MVKPAPPSSNFLDIIFLRLVARTNIFTRRHSRYIEDFLVLFNGIFDQKTFIIPTDAHYYKNHRMLKRFKNYNTCSDMFRFTQEPSSWSSPVLSKNYRVWFSVLGGIDSVIFMAAYQPVVQACSS